MTRTRLSLIAMAALTLLLVLPIAARAATISVDTTADALNASDRVCSLREAVIAANDDQPSGSVPGECSAGSGADTIDVPGGEFQLTLQGANEDFASSGDLDLIGQVDIAGAGDGSTGTQIAGVKDRVFDVRPGAVASISDTEILNGQLPQGSRGTDGTTGSPGGPGGSGGGIRNAGTLALRRIDLHNNKAGDGGVGGGGTGVNGQAGANGTPGVGAASGPAGDGGGISTSGPLTIADSVIDTNFGGNGLTGGTGSGGRGGDGAPAGSGGGAEGGRGGRGGTGGIEVDAGGSLTMSGSTVSHNAAGRGGNGGGAQNSRGGDATGNATGGNGGANRGGNGAAGGAGGIAGIGAISITTSSITSNSGGPGGDGGSASGGAGGSGAGSGNGGNGGLAEAGDAGPGGSGGGIAASDLESIERSLVANNSAGAGGIGASGFGAGGGAGGGGGGHAGSGSLAIGGDGGNGGFGGGLDVFAGAPTITNVTLSANATGSGGNAGGGATFSGAINGGSGGNGGDGGNAALTGATLTNATVVGGAAGGGGTGNPGSANGVPGVNGTPGVGRGVVHDGGQPLAALNSIFASTMCAGGLTDGGQNIRFDDANTCPGTVGDPKLAPLADNGGPTQTAALGAGSAALDVVPATGAGCPATDQRGAVRPFGSGCDAGAFEVAPPDVSSGDPQTVGVTSATVGGTVTPRGLATTYDVEFGETTAYDQTAGSASSSSETPVDASVQLDGLQPSTTYHYRFVAQSPDGAATGEDRMFTTSATPVVNTTAPPSLTSLRVHPARFRARRHARISYRLSAGARVTLMFQRLRGHGKARRFATVTRSGKGGANAFRFHRRIGGKALKHGRYRIVAVARNAAGASSRATRRFTIIRG